VTESVITVVKNWLSQNSDHRFTIEKEATGRYTFIPVKDGAKLTDKGVALNTFEADAILREMSGYHAGRLSSESIAATHMLVLKINDGDDIKTVIRGVWSVFNGFRRHHEKTINEAKSNGFAVLVTGEKEWILYLYHRFQECKVPVNIELVD
jgi:hypothetical protein